MFKVEIIYIKTTKANYSEGYIPKTPEKV